MQSGMRKLQTQFFIAAKPVSTVANFIPIQFKTGESQHLSTSSCVLNFGYRQMIWLSRIQIK